MRKWISSVVVALALVACGDANDNPQSPVAQSADVEEMVAAQAPKLVLIRVKGEVKTMDAVKNGEAVALNATKEELAASPESAERLFAAGEPITIVESLQSDDGDEASTQSWRFGWGGWGWRGGLGWNNWGWNNWGWNSLGFGWPAWNFYRPYTFYNPVSFGGAGCCATTLPYYWGGYTYYPYFW